MVKLQTLYQFCQGVPQGIVRPQMEYVTEFWKITHIGAREIITIFMFGGLLIREDMVLKIFQGLYCNLRY